MEFSLTVLNGRRAGASINACVVRFLIGRDQLCSLRLASQRASRFHCEILQVRGRLILRDFRSRNGTFLHGERIDAPRVLHDGDEVRLAGLRFQFEMTLAPDDPDVERDSSIFDDADETELHDAMNEELTALNLDILAASQPWSSDTITEHPVPI